MNPSRDSAGRASGHAALLVVQLCFGLFPLFGIWAFESFSPRAIVGWRLVVAAGFFMVLATAIHGKGVLLPFSTLVRIQVFAILGIVLNQLLFLEGLNLSTSTHAGLLMASIPVVTLVIALLVRQEQFSLRRGVGIIVAFTGTAVLFASEGFDFSSELVRGDALMFCNVVLYSIYLVGMKPVMKAHPSLIVAAWAFVASVWTVPLFAWNETWLPEAASVRSWWSLAAVLVFATIVAYLLNLFALARVGASTVASYIFLQPLIAAFAGWCFLDETMNAATWFAAGAILVGLALVVIRR